MNSEPVNATAASSALARYPWKDRGRAPTGYLRGMALMFADLSRDLEGGDEVAVAIAAAPGSDPSRDVLDWYREELEGAGFSFDRPIDRLTAVMTILLGLGMRESSGMHCEGRDESATNVTSETAEAGLFQVSYNSVGSHALLRPLFERFRGKNDLLEVFAEGVTCSASSWKNWGAGPGVEFQALSKQCPRFAVLYAALLLRHERQHWGPIDRKEAEVIPNAFGLLASV